MSSVFQLNPLKTRAQEAISGFTAASATRETAIEGQFNVIPSLDEEKRQHRIFTSQPHVAGSKRNNELANYIADEWRKQGLEDVVLRRYDVYATDPKSTFLEMVAPVHYRASLREEGYDANPDTNNAKVSAAWSAMSISGEVTAPVVYAHSGNPEDYDLLPVATRFLETSYGGSSEFSRHCGWSRGDKMMSYPMYSPAANHDGGTRVRHRY